MTIAAQLIALAGIKADMLTALQAKGSTADGATPFTSYAAEIDGLAVGGGASDPYWANVALLLNFTGADGSTVVTDAKGHAATVYGDAKIRPVPSGGMLVLDGTGDYVTFADSADWSMGSGDFAIEIWATTATVADSDRLLLDHGASSNYSQFQFRRSGSTLYFLGSYANNGYNVSFDVGVMTANKWHHAAAVRSGSLLYLFLDGALRAGGAVSITSGLWDNSAPLTVGSQGGGALWTGNVGGVRITRDVARYTANFTPPTVPFPTA